VALTTPFFMKQESLRLLFITIIRKTMNLKRIFGAVLTLLGIVSLVSAAVMFVNNSVGSKDVKALLTYGTLGFVFFVSGISLVRTTRDDS